MIHGSSGTAQRLGSSSSHHETLAAVKAKEIAQMVNMRFSEVLQSGFVLPDIRLKEYVLAKKRRLIIHATLRCSIFDCFFLVVVSSWSSKHLGEYQLKTF